VYAVFTDNVRTAVLEKTRN